MILKMISVQFTGTHYMISLLSRLGNPISFSHHTDFIDSIGDGPLIVPIRDPMLAEISRVNRGFGPNIEEWMKITTLWGRPETHWFQIDTVDRPTEMANLIAFVAATKTDNNWLPRWESSDPGDLKGNYRRGTIPPQANRAYRWLQRSQEVKDLFVNLGYSYPWMN